MQGQLLAASSQDAARDNAGAGAGPPSLRGRRQGQPKRPIGRSNALTTVMFSISHVC